MHSFARSVTRPRSPGPAPTRKHLPKLSFVLLLSIDLLQQLRCEMLSVVTCAFHFAFAGRRRSVFENLRAQFHFAVLHFRQDSNRRLAITLQQPQKFALCSQAKQRVAIVDWIDNLSRAFIIAANLERNDPLPASGQKNFARKNLHEKFAAVEVHFASRQRRALVLPPLSSPTVRMMFVSIVRSSHCACNRSATMRACVRANSLPRVPSTVFCSGDL